MIKFRYLGPGPQKNHNRWLMLNIGPDRQYALRIGKPEFKLFSERNQGADGVPKRYYYLLGDRLTLRIWRKR